jgi:hypothetical protein
MHNVKQRPPTRCALWRTGSDYSTAKAAESALRESFYASADYRLNQSGFIPSGSEIR